MFSGDFVSTMKDLLVGGLLLGLGGFVGWVWNIDHAVSSSKFEATQIYVSKEDFIEFKTWLKGELLDIKLTFKSFKETN